MRLDVSDDDLDFDVVDQPRRHLLVERRTYGHSITVLGEQKKRVFLWGR